MSRRVLKLTPGQLTFCLSIALVIKTSSVFAQSEDYAGYRHEFYLEDDNRMSIDTDTLGFDVGLGARARFTGQLVMDAISGATPTGAPPQNQWPFPTFQTFYNQNYAPLLNNAITNQNNLILYQSGYFPSYEAYTNYIAQNNPQLGTQATNSAAASYNALTNSPSYHNKTVPLTQIHDRRRAFSFGVPLTFGNQQFTPQFSYSTESDYHSVGLALNYAIQLNQKNTTLNAGWSHDNDRVRDDTLVNWQSKVSDEVLIGINQLLTPKSYVTADLTYGQEYGYLSDPYRGVMALQNFPQYNPEDAALIPEKRPRRRTEQIFYTSYAQFFDSLNGSGELGYRFFHDSYGILANTVESTWHQKLGRHFVFSPGFRYYTQTAANFYYVLVPDFNNLPADYSADYRLSEFQSFNFSADLTYRVLNHLSVDLSYTRYIMQGLDGVTSQSAYPSANVYSVGVRLWF